MARPSWWGVVAAALRAAFSSLKVALVNVKNLISVFGVALKTCESSITTPKT